MGIYTFPDGFLAGVKAQKVHINASLYVAGAAEVDGGVVMDASAVIGDASGDLVGLHGKAAAKSGHIADPDGASATGVETAVEAIIACLEALGLAATA